jgi:hypothetical protein
VFRAIAFEQSPSTLFCRLRQCLHWLGETPLRRPDRNSTGGAKRVASINRNFVSFEDSAPIRRIDLVSVLDKGVGIGVKLLTAIIEDACRRGLEEVKVVTDRDNVTALRTYRAVGFQPERSLAVLHLLR